MANQKKILAIVGPTASGKTKLSIMLAERIQAQIISADSRQIYKYLDIGTAKPTVEELQKIPHHFINILNPDQEYNAAEYGQQVRAIIKELLNKGTQPIIVGGSGLYIKALLDGFFEGPGKDAEIRKQLEEELRTIGIEALFEKLKKVDPITAAKIDKNNPRRVIRALEVFYKIGKPISDLHTVHDKKPTLDVMQFGLDWERKRLYDRINKRVEKMIEDGLVKEVHRLIAKGYFRHINALNTVGYKEAFDFIEGKITEREMVRLIKQNTRRYAKRQLTWFRADKRICWIHVDEEMNFNGIAELIIKKFRAGR